MTEPGNNKVSALPEDAVSIARKALDELKASRPAAKVSKTEIAKELKADIRELRKAGFSFSQIAEQLSKAGVSITKSSLSTAVRKRKRATVKSVEQAT